MPIALHYLGLDPNTQNPDDYAKAEALIKSISPYVRYFNSAKYPQDLANGDICVALGWSGGMLAARNMALAANNGNDNRLSNELIRQINLKLGPPEDMGKGPDGTRINYPIIGGTFTGKGMQGTVVPGGAGWCLYVGGP